MLDIFDNDLYNAWDSAYHTEIEDFTTPEGMKATAYQDVWLDKVPNILFFQISRV